MTDNGSNVIKTAHNLIDDFKKALNTDVADLPSVWGLTAAGVAAAPIDDDDDELDDNGDALARALTEDDTRVGDDDDNAAADDDDDDVNIELEYKRASRCLNHIFNLIVSDWIKQANLEPDIKNVDDVNNSVGRSTVRQQQLAYLQRLGAPARKPLSLIRRVATRWHSAHDSIKRFLELHTYLIVMFVQGSFKKSALTMPSPDVRPKLNAFVEVRFVRCRRHTLSYLLSLDSRRNQTDDEARRGRRAYDVPRAVYRRAPAGVPQRAAWRRRALCARPVARDGVPVRPRARAQVL